MAFISTLKFFAKLDQIPLIDAVSGNSLRVVGSGSASLLTDKLGYQMREQQHLQLTDISLNITNKASVGFWLNPVNPGVVRDPVSEDLKPLRMSVMDIQDLGGDEIFLVHEETDKDGKNNRLKVIVDSNVTLLSSKYTISNWHHFWIFYDGSAGSVKLFVDGKEDQSSTSGVPPDLSTSVGTVNISRQALGTIFDVGDNTGGIDDVVVLNDAISSSATLKKIINTSTAYAFDTSFENNDEVDQGFLFNDPNAFTVTALVDDGTSLLASRTDGKILEGLPLFWETLRRFQDPEEASNLDIFGDGFSIENGSLVISGKAVVKT